MESKQLVIKVMQNLILTYTAQNNDKRKDAQYNLKELENDPKFLEALIQIILQKSLAQNIRMSSANYIKTYSLSLINQKKQQLKKQTIVLSFRMLEQNLQMKLKKTILSTLNYICNRETETNIRTGLANNLLLRLEKFIKNNVYNAMEIQYLILFAQFFMNCPYDQKVYQVLGKIFFTYVNIGLSVINEYNNKVAQNLDMNLLLKDFILIQQFVNFLKLIFKKQDFPRHDIFKNIIQSKELDNIIQKLLLLKINQNQTINTFIYVNQHYLSNNLNSVKANCIYILDILMKAITFLRKDNIQFYANNIFVKRSEQYIPYFLQNICILLENRPYYELYEYGKIKIVEQCLRYFSTLLSSHHYYQYFSVHTENIIYKIIIPLLMITPNQKQKFVTNSDQFLNNIIQTIERSTSRFENTKQESNDDLSLHIVVSKFLACYVKEIDGTLHKIFKICKDKIQIQQNTDQKLTYFVIIGILSTVMKDRVDLQKQLLEYVLRQIEYMPLALQSTVLSEKIKICLIFIIISKYLIFFTPIMNTFSQKVLRLIIKILKGQIPNNNEALMIVSFDALYATFRLQNKIVRENSSSILNMLIQLLINYDEISMKLFDAILELIRQNEELKNNLQLMSLCISLLISKVEKFFSKNDYNRDITNKCFNIIRQITCYRAVNVNIINPVSIQLQRMFQWIPLNTKTDFQEDLLIIYTQFLLHSKKVSNSHFKFIQYFPTILVQYKYNLNHLYTAINNLLMHGSHYIIQSIDTVKILLDIGFSSASKQSRGNITEVDNTQGMLILQYVIYKFGEIFNQELWGYILQRLFKRMETPKIKFRFLTANLIATFSLALSKSFRVIQTNPQLLHSLYKLVIQKPQIFNDQYSGKVYLIGICNTITNNFESEFIKQKLIQLMKTALLVIRTLTEIQQANQMKNNIEQQDEEITQDEISDYNSKIEDIKNCFKQIEHFQLFKQIFEELKKNHPEIWNYLISNFGETEKLYLKKILKTEIVEHYRREIFKIKRN